MYGHMYVSMCACMYGSMLRFRYSRNNNRFLSWMDRIAFGLATGSIPVGGTTVYALAYVCMSVREVAKE